jgi:predicted nucleic acid-binding Zn ribbon protein
MASIDDRQCLGCGGSIARRSPRARYCSQRCRSRVRQRRRRQRLRQRLLGAGEPSR